MNNFLLRAFHLALILAFVSAFDQAYAQTPNTKKAQVSPEMPASVDAFVPDYDTADLLYIHPKEGAVILRFRLSIDRVGYQARWRSYSDRLFKALDRDKDGVVSMREGDPKTVGNRLNAFINNLRQGGATPNGSGTAAFPSNGIKSAKEMQDYLSRRSPAFQASVTNAVDQRYENFYSLLDVDKNKVLSQEEIDKAAYLIESRDFDETGQVELAEMTAFSSPYGNRQAYQQSTDQGRTAGQFYSLGTDALRKAAASAWADFRPKPKTPSYTQPKPTTKISQDQFGRSEKVFQQYDQDRDHLLGPLELEKYLANPDPDVIITLDLSKKPGVGGAFSSSLVTDRAGRVPLDVRSTSPSSVQVRVDQVWIDIQGQAVGPGQVDLRMFYSQQFAASDGDGNGYIEQKESVRNGIFSSVFTQMDLDGDGKLFPEEMNAFMDRYQDEADSRAQVQIAYHGNVLFAAVDSDGNQSLGPRELNNLTNQAKGWDRDHNGQIDSNEIPHRVQLSLSQAPLNFEGAIQFGVSPIGMAQVARVNRVTNAPVWFQKMDRNQDGDVSNQEFLGSTSDFRKLDANSDNLIDTKEASSVSSRRNP